MSKKPSDGRRIICENRKARFEYELGQRIEAGIVLQGSEVKSLRNGKASLSDAYARLEGDEMFLFQAHIDEYAPASYQNHDPKRPRKLLLKREELDKLSHKLRDKGAALIPLMLYFQDAFAKVELALAQGKREYQKDETQRERELSREIARSVRSREIEKRRNER
jgi:SsrA-binding protein